jgi:hypothetical protein
MVVQVLDFNWLSAHRISTLSFLHRLSISSTLGHPPRCVSQHASSPNCLRSGLCHAFSRGVEIVLGGTVHFPILKSEKRRCFETSD